MNETTLREILEQVHRRELEVDAALERLQHLPFEGLGETVKVDHHRLVRQGFPEFVYAEGKRPEEVAQVLQRLAATQGGAMATRVPPEMLPTLRSQLPQLRYDERARVAWLGGPLRVPGYRSLRVALVTGGTSDVPVAEEAAHVLQFLAHQVVRVYDVGVAGVHRLLDQVPTLREADALIVVAGMEGALPSVVGGLVAAPLIAVPTSVGYGAHWGGIAPLLAMLNSCAAGITVVNIDNGFGAALAVHRMARE